MKIKSIIFPIFLMVGGASAQSTVGVLGTPADGSTISGVSTISGYHCTSKNIEVFIDGVSFGKAGAGTQLLGTLGVCGRTDAGYSLLYNFSNLDNGVHTISVTADGAPLATNTITTVKSGGEQWLTGVNKQIKAPDFPHAGQFATLDWVQSYQNFMVTGIGETIGLQSLNGTYSQTVSLSVSGSSCSAYDTGNVPMVITAGALANDPSSTVIYAVPDTGDDVCVFFMDRTSGNSGTGYGLDGTVGCASLPADDPVVGTGVKKADDGLRLLGTLTISHPGCTQTVVLF